LESFFQKKFAFYVNFSFQTAYFINIFFKRFHGITHKLIKEKS